MEKVQGLAYCHSAAMQKRIGKSENFWCMKDTKKCPREYKVSQNAWVTANLFWQQLKWLEK
jgi:hypothetical protein